MPGQGLRRLLRFWVHQGLRPVIDFASARIDELDFAVDGRQDEEDLDDLLETETIAETPEGDLEHRWPNDTTIPVDEKWKGVSFVAKEAPQQTMLVLEARGAPQIVSLPDTTWEALGIDPETMIRIVGFRVNSYKADGPVEGLLSMLAVDGVTKNLLPTDGWQRMQTFKNLRQIKPLPPIDPRLVSPPQVSLLVDVFGPGRLFVGLQIYLEAVDRRPNI